MPTLTSIRKVANLTWSTDIVGAEATLEVELPGGVTREERVVKNTPAGGDLFFPPTFSGTINVTVRGSASGQETGPIVIP